MKKMTKILCGVLGLGFLLTGCATVGNIKNSSEEIVYNGNSAVLVDGHIYYGNAFADIETFTGDSSFKSSAKLSYLARLNTNIELETNGKDYSPNDVEKVKETVVGQANSFMFVLGNYIYYATPNREEVGGEESVEFKYAYTTLYRSKLNGDSVKKIYTTDANISQIEVLKHDGKYYIVIFAGSKLVKIQIGNKVGKAETIADDVLQVAMPETYQKDKEGSSLDFNGYVYYTTARTSEEYAGATGTQFNRVLLSENEGEKMNATLDSIAFVGREKDVVFYTKDGSTYSVNVANTTAKNIFTESSYATRLYGEAVSDIDEIATENRTCGYVFKAGETLMYKANGSSAVGVKFNDKANSPISDYNFLATDGRVKYLSTETAIYKADFSTIDAEGTIVCETIVSMSGIHKGSKYAYDGKYIYFYAQLQELEGADEETKIVDEDANFYLYRAKADVNPSTETLKYELLSLTQTEKRHS